MKSKIVLLKYYVYSISEHKISFQLQLRNPGPSTVETASIRIFWPSLFEDGGDLFMLKDVPKVIEGQGNCSIVSGTDHLQVRSFYLFFGPILANLYSNLERIPDI